MLIGTAVFLLGWLGNVTIGIWFLRAGVEVITFILLAALVMRAAADPDEPLRLPLPPAFVALGLSIVAAIIAVQHTGEILKTRRRDRRTGSPTCCTSRAWSSWSSARASGRPRARAR